EPVCEKAAEPSCQPVTVPPVLGEVTELISALNLAMEAQASSAPTVPPLPDNVAAMLESRGQDEDDEGFLISEEEALAQLKDEPVGVSPTAVQALKKAILDDKPFEERNEQFSNPENDGLTEFQQKILSIISSESDPTTFVERDERLEEFA